MRTPLLLVIGSVLPLCSELLDAQADRHATVPVATSKPKAVAAPMQQLERALLFSDSPTERVEVNGVMYELADLLRAQEEAGSGPMDAPWRTFEALVLQTLREELVRRELWLDDEAFTAAWDEHRQYYEGSAFSIGVVATKFKGFPDLDTYRTRWRVQRSFVESLGKQAFEPDELAKELQDVATAALICGYQLTAELWFHPASRAADGRADFGAAVALAAKSRAAVLAGAGLPEGVINSWVGEDKPVVFNQVRRALGGSEYAELLQPGVAARLFDPALAPRGEIVGPWRSPNGVYLARVTYRRKMKNAVDIQEDRVQRILRPLAEQRQFRAWANAVLGRAVIRLAR